MFLTKYGYSTLGWIAVILFILITVALFINNNYAKYSIIIASLVFLGLALNFFRDPDRNTPKGDNIVVSPADGKVLIIKNIYDERYLKAEAKQISIFMSPLNVHVNRIPVSGIAEYVNYVEGKYLVAFHDKADTENERNEIGIKSEHGKVLFTQVAGFLARRIVSEVNRGDSLKTGERFGMIKFGSRVDVIVPKNWIVKVKKDDFVKAGETILYEIPDENRDN